MYGLTLVQVDTSYYLVLIGRSSPPAQADCSPPDYPWLARNTEDLLRLVKEFTEQGISLKFHKEHLDFTGESNPMQQLMLTMLGGIYQFERAMILERQREGIAIAKHKGKYKGKPVNVALREQIQQRYADGMNKLQIAKTLGCARATVYKALTEL